MTSFQISQSSWSNLDGSWMSSDLEPTSRPTKPTAVSALCTWTEFGASLADAVSMIEEHDDDDDDDDIYDDDKDDDDEYDDDIKHADGIVRNNNKEHGDSAKDKDRYKLDQSIISLDLDDLGLDETSHCGNKSAHFAPPRSSSLPPHKPRQSAGFLPSSCLPHDPVMETASVEMGARRERSTPPGGDSIALHHDGMIDDDDESTAADETLLTSRQWLLHRLENVYQKSNTKEASMAPSLLSLRLLKDSLSSLDYRQGDCSTTTEDVSIPPSSLLLAQKLRRDSLTSLDRGAESDDNGDSFAVLPTSSRLTRHLLHDSLTLMRYNGSASVLTDDTDPAQEASAQSPLSRRLNRYGKSQNAAGASVETEDSIPVSSLLSTRGGRRKGPHDSLTLARYNDTSASLETSLETEDSGLVKSPLARRRLQDSLMLSRYNSSGSVETEDSGQPGPSMPFSMRRLQDSLMLSRYNSSGSVETEESGQPGASLPFSMRRLQDSLMLSRYNTSSDTLDEQEDSFCQPPSPHSRRMPQDSLTLSRYNSSDSLDETDNDIELDDFTVDLIQVLQLQIAILQDKLTTTKRFKSARRKSVQHQHHQTSHIGSNSPKSLHEFFDSEAVESFPQDCKVVQTDDQDNEDTWEQTKAGLFRTMTQLTSSLARLEQHQPRPTSSETAYTDQLFFLITITEQIKASQCLLYTLRQDDDETWKRTLDQNAAQLAQIERGLEKRQKLALL